MNVDEKDPSEIRDNSMEQEMIEQITELMYKLELSSAKVEQSAYDSINTTDQVMMGLKNIMDLMQKISNRQNDLQAALKIASLSLNQQESSNLDRLIQEHIEQSSLLEMELHKVIAAAMEANDAARCIEAGIAEQNEHLNDLLQHNEAFFGQQV